MCGDIYIKDLKCMSSHYHEFLTISVLENVDTYFFGVYIFISVLYIYMRRGIKICVVLLNRSSTLFLTALLVERGVYTYETMFE